MVRRAKVVLGLTALVAVALASSSAGQGPPPGPGPPGGPPGLDKAKEVKEKHADKLLDKPGVAGIGVSLKRNGKAVIRIYKEKADVQDIPESLDDVPVESVVTGVLEPRAPTDRFSRPVPIGVSSGHFELATGTLGARVTDGTNVYALSNNHVYAGVNNASIGDSILQPGPIEDGGTDPEDRIGTLFDFQAINFEGGDNTMDAAIALTTIGEVGTATPPDGYGSPSTTPTAASIGMGVQKYGRTTGFQQGTVADVNLTVDVCYFPFGQFCFQEARFVNQFSVTPGPFSAPGDSGSLIVTQGGNQPVGLLFAGGDGLTIGNPIAAVLQRFNVTIEGGPPVSGPPTAPTNLRATGGDDLVELTWNAPTFDGGSQVSHYRIFRGPSPGNESFLALSTSPFHTDATAENGATYYYKVSAVNGNGEGPLSNGANATPVALVTPSTPLAILDDFNRADENPLSDQGRWSNAIIGGESGHNVTSNQLACGVTTTCTAWRNNAQFGPDVEVYARMSILPGLNNQLRLYARLQLPGHNGYLLRTLQQSATDEVWIERFDGGGAVRLLTISQELTAGDVILLRAKGSTIEAWRHSGSAWSRLGVVQDATHGAPGFVGVGLRGQTGRLDDFGARGLGTSSPPGAPTGLLATAGDAQVALTWNAPSDGGSPITSYKVYRGTSPAGETLLPTPTITSTSYTDTTAANGTTYYYKVSAVNAVNEGPLSNEASATPVALVPPSAPLATLDDFNRPNENPLSDQGRWSNAIIGGESGHNVTSNQLACAVTTTCTARRNNAQYGPDVEVYARLSTLPGVNNQLRLYARLQVPALNGYLLRTNQLSGTDEVWVERFDGGGAVRLLTISQELTAGDIILLRARGSTIEAWRQNGTAWSRLGFVQSATHSAAGYVGVGLRGTTGRVDDFGARTLGGAPATPPTAPQNLQATAGNAQVALTWSAPASDGGSTITSYKVYRGTNPGGESLLPTPTITATSYTDTTAANGTTYYYKVSAVNAVNEGPLSNEASATPTAPATPPTAPQNLQATAGNAQVALTWSAPASDGGSTITSYKVYRGTNPGGESLLPTPTITATSYTDTTAANGTTYYYKVSAVNAVNEGPLSNEASATPQPPPDTTPPSAPGTLSTSVFSSTRIDLSWGAATDTVGITLYRIERCEGAGCANFTEIATVNAPATSYQNTGLAPSTSHSYRVRAEDAALNRGLYSNLATATTQGSPKPMYFSLEDNGTVGGVSVANEDVVSFDGASAFSLAFDGSDVGLSSRRLDAFTWLDSDTLLFSLDNDGASLPGVGTVDDSDVVRFDASSLGSTTAGTFSMYVDGSDVGLTTNAEDVDAFELLGNGNLLISTEGSVGVTGVSGEDEDLLAFTPSTLGATTSGTWVLYYDGSDVGLTASGEDVDAVAVDAAGRIHLSTRNDFAVTGVSGADEDVFVFTPSTLGTNTTGTFSSSLYFDGSAFGFARSNVFAIDLP